MDGHMDEYFDCVSDLTQLDEIQRLHDYVQHLNTSRLEHCINVSYISYRICKRYGWDYRSAARAGLLHDFYLYDRHDASRQEERHVSAHPKAALQNAQQITSLNEVEIDAIATHMWPMTAGLPKYRESYVVNFADTFCAVYECASQARRKLRNMRRRLQHATV